MAHKEEIIYALELFHANRPRKMFHEMDQRESGMFAVIKFLAEAEGEVTSAAICKHLQISSARMTVLIKRLETKGLVIKTESLHDSRSKALVLTQKGVTLATKLQAHMYETVGKIIDEFGITELETLFETLNRLKSILNENAPLSLEEYDD